MKKYSKLYPEFNSASPAYITTIVIPDRQTDEWELESA